MINTWDVPDVEDTKVFHAGTRLDGDRTVTAGGRVLCVCALGDSVAHAQQRAYADVAGISWPGEFHRHDIGWRATERGRGGIGRASGGGRGGQYVAISEGPGSFK